MSITHILHQRKVINLIRRTDLRTKIGNGQTLISPRTNVGSIDDKRERDAKQNAETER